jgi:hypothetical protein
MKRIMRRRSFLTAGLCGLSAATLAGCAGTNAGGGETPEPTTTGSDEELPDGVYVQQFRETMSMQGTASAGELKTAVMYTSPHQFWRVVGDELQAEPVEEEDSLHLMAAVWEPETGTVVPEAGVSVEIAPEGGAFDEQVIYPMLSQAMGFHYGANFSLDGDGEYTVRVSVGGMNIRRTGAFEGRFGEAASATVDISFNEANRNEVEFRELDSYGDPGAVQPVEMMMPDGIAPPVESMPGEHVGTARSDDALLPAFVVREAPLVGDGPYLYVSARTPYNEYVLPAAGFEARVDRDGDTVFDGELTRTLDPELKYHYGAAVDALQPGDEITLSTVTPPQVARHEGYERALLELGEVTYTV